MKKIEIKKGKNSDKIETKKIDDLYSKKISARKVSVMKSSIPMKPLRKEDVLKKAPVFVASEEDDLSGEESMEKKVPRVGIAKAPKKIAPKKNKAVMSDMLPQNEIIENDNEEMEEVEEVAEMTKDELLGRVPIQADTAVLTDEEPDYGEMTKDELLGRTPINNEEKVAAESEGDSDDEKAVEAMREEIKNKMKEKKAMEMQQAEPFANRTTLDESEKKSFLGIFSFGKKKEVDSPAEVIEEKMENRLADESEDGKKELEKKMTRNGLAVAFLVFVIMVTIGATAFYFYVQYRSPGMVPNVSLSSAEQAKKDADETKRLVGEVIELPDDEEPILATVTDVAKVKNQKFFAKAQNGDRVLIYTINKKAILFRPATNKIIEVSQVSGLDYNADSKKVEDTQAEIDEANKGADAKNTDEKEATNDTPTQTDDLVKVAIYNGSKIKGLAQKIGDKVTLVSGTAVGEKTNATGEFEKTIVIDLSGEHDDMVQRIAESLQATVAQLPEGEKKPAADILIIGGSDFKVD